jgi:hypothetical protein
MANRNLLEEAIADAKAVKEVAIANAKAALEEAFTPHLKNMLSQKINEMDEIDEVEVISEESRKERANVDKYEYEKGKLKGQNKFDKEVSTKIDENEEMDEELNLDELLAELELGENARTDAEEEGYKDGMKDEKEDLSEESEAERANVDKFEYEKGKEAGEDDDEIDLDDMSEEELKAMIEDVIEDMVSSGDLEAGGDAVEMSDEETEEVEDIDIDIEDEEEVAIDEGFLDFLKKKKEEAPKPKPGDNDPIGVDYDGNYIYKESLKLKEAKNAIQHLKFELNEINLLNSKLLYTNKIFRGKTLTENQKIKVLKAFDRAETAKEAKSIYTTLNENLTTKNVRSNIREAMGMASKPAGVAPKRPLTENIIQEDAMVARFKKLAGIN